jgi:hypothetical protein
MEQGPFWDAKTSSFFLWNSFQINGNLYLPSTKTNHCIQQCSILLHVSAYRPSSGITFFHVLLVLFYHCIYGRMFCMKFCKLCIFVVMFMYSYVCSVLYILFSLCCSVYCLCVNVNCTTATGCQPNCSQQIHHIISYHTRIIPFQMIVTYKAFHLFLKSSAFMPKDGRRDRNM